MPPEGVDLGSRLNLRSAPADPFSRRGTAPPAGNRLDPNDDDYPFPPTRYPEHQFNRGGAFNQSATLNQGGALGGRYREQSYESGASSYARTDLKLKREDVGIFNPTFDDPND